MTPASFQVVVVDLLVLFVFHIDVLQQVVRGMIRQACVHIKTFSKIQSLWKGHRTLNKIRWQCTESKNVDNSQDTKIILSSDPRLAIFHTEISRKIPINITYTTFLGKKIGYPYNIGIMNTGGNPGLAM